MRQTQKYVRATEILTVPHSSHEQLYSELNRLGWWWNAKLKLWERDDRQAIPPTKDLRIRLWADKEKVEDHKDLIVQLLRENGYEVNDISEPYECRPPKQNESRIYLTVQKCNGY